MSLQGARGFEGYPPAHMSYAAQATAPETQPSQSDLPARLLGPGMPGPAAYASHTYQPIPAVPSISARPMEPRFPGSSYTRQRSESPHYYRSPRAPPVRSPRYPSTSQPSSWHQRDPLRTLPPLVPSSSYSTRRAHSPSPYMSSRLAHGPPHSTSPESRFAHIPPEIPSRSSISLPPPFAMQPSPQWNQTFQSVPRHVISSPWSRRDSRSTIERPSVERPTIERSPLSVTARRERTMGGSITDPSEGHRSERTASPLHSSSHLTPPSSSAPLSRPGRYDPVRATFITRSTPTLLRVTSPVHQSGEDSEGGGEEEEEEEEEKYKDPKPHASPPRENR